MEDHQDIHCIPNNENILGDNYAQVLEASIMEEKKIKNTFSIKYLVHNKVITNMTFFNRLLKTSKLKS
jgi:hypothetical protein